jgi:DNA-binding NarL/FixJ family response regulator
MWDSRFGSRHWAEHPDVSLRTTLLGAKLGANDHRHEAISGHIQPLSVARGDALLAPSVTRRLITEFARRPPQSAPQPLPGLTPRETEVLTQVARGLSNREIASQLFLGEATIKTYVGNILMKLGCRDRVQAVVAAYEAGLVQPGHHR